MNSDDIMYDLPTGDPSQTGADDDSSLFGVNTNINYDSQSQPGSSANGASSGSAPGAWNTKKFRDLYDSEKAKLLHQEHDSSKGHDPLLPRPKQVNYLPPGMSKGTAKKLEEEIARLRANRA